MIIFSDERLAALGAVCGTASRHGGSGRNIKNLKRFFDILNIDFSNMLRLKQTHGEKIIDILAEKDFLSYKKSKPQEADAWLLGKDGAGVIILTADCAPLYVWDNGGKFIGLAHCGWRGVVSGLPSKLAKRIKEKAGNNAKLCAYIGPHINSCCFEVKNDVASMFGQESIIKRDGRIFVDLTKEITCQLISNGVGLGDIKSECKCRCTCCDAENFFSYRRDGTKNALISFAYKAV
ncbi:MAG: polyphenol oxidase family protein [Elusimicrobiota bacterium]|jgi:YfiH family protein|nr:polyphenol oxidase family protein [Elusimicrobiota bacterium]